MNGEMNEWFRKNLGTVILLLGFLISLVVQWTLLSQAADLTKVTSMELLIHEHDTRRHIDPERDERRWQDLLERLKNIEDSLRRRR